MAEALTAGSETYFVGLLLHLFFKKKKNGAVVALVFSADGLLYRRHVRPSGKQLCHLALS